MKWPLFFVSLYAIYTANAVQPHNQMDRNYRGTYQIIFPGGDTFSYARLVGTIDRALNDVTLCHWSRTNSNNGKFASVFSYNTEEENALLSYILHNKKVKLHRYMSSVTVDSDTPNTKWLHICATWSVADNSLQMFINGKKVGNYNLSGVNKPLSANGVVILGQDQDVLGGGFDINQALTGQISEVHVWDYILTADEILQVSKCNNDKEGNVIGWNQVIWSLYNGSRVSHVNLPCGRDMSPHCDNHKMELF